MKLTNVDHELLNAYRELWVAVENGTVGSKFFKLRERFRKIAAKYQEGFTNGRIRSK